MCDNGCAARPADILSMTPEELSGFVTETLSEKPFRAAQIYGWMMKGASVDEMTNVPAALREKLKEKCEYRLPTIARRLVSKKDGTRKYLFELQEAGKSVLNALKLEYGDSWEQEDSE